MDIGIAGKNFPLGSDWILNNERNGGEQHTIVLERLANEHRIKRVSMEWRKLVEMQNGAFFEGQRGHSMPFPIGHDEAIACAGQRKLPKSMLNGDFPDQHRTEQDLIVGIGKDPSGVRRKLLRARDDP
jgi:hypothetical protein